MRLEPRIRVPFVLVILAPVVSIVASFVLCAGLVAWSGASIFEAYGLLLKGALGSGFALSETFARATPLIFTGLAAAVAFKSRFWNIGAEGQLYAKTSCILWEIKISESPPETSFLSVSKNVSVS